MAGSKSGTRDPEAVELRHWPSQLDLLLGSGASPEPSRTGLFAHDAVARHAFARGASIAARRSMIVMATLVSMSASPAAIAAC
jgi:hypothetical protein